MKLKSNKGQGIMEYIILSSLIGIFSLIAIKNYGVTLQKRVTYMQKKITKNISIR